MLVQLGGGIVHILTMLNDVVYFTVTKREVAHIDKKVGHPGSMVRHTKKFQHNIIYMYM